MKNEVKSRVCEKLKGIIVQSRQLNGNGEREWASLRK